MVIAPDDTLSRCVISARLFFWLRDSFSYNTFVYSPRSIRGRFPNCVIDLFVVARLRLFHLLSYSQRLLVKLLIWFVLRRLLSRRPQWSLAIGANG